MKKILFPITIFLAIPMALAPVSPVFAQPTETMNLTTYYPSPTGNYAQVRLVPRAAGEPVVCNNSNPNSRGIMYFGRTGLFPENVMRVCQDDGTGNLAWVPLGGGGPWTRNGTNLVPTNIGDTVGIGTNAPQAMLHVHGGSVGNLTAGIRLDHDLSNVSYQVLPGIPGANEAGFSIHDNTANLNRFVIDSAGNIGIGTDAPVFNSKFDVKTTQAWVGMDEAAGSFDSSGVGGGASFGIKSSASGGNNANIGIRAEAKGNAGNTGFNYGVQGFAQVDGTENKGVYGVASAWANIPQYGVYGLASGRAGTRYGVYGEGSGDTGIKYGTYGKASGTGTNYGVYGTASGGTTNYAGYFQGNVNAVGMITSSHASGNSIVLQGADGSSYGSRIRYGGTGPNRNKMVIQGPGDREVISFDSNFLAVTMPGGLSVGNSLAVNSGRLTGSSSLFTKGVVAGDVGRNQSVIGSVADSSRCILFLQGAYGEFWGGVSSGAGCTFNGNDIEAWFRGDMSGPIDGRVACGYLCWY